MSAKKARSMILWGAYVIGLGFSPDTAAKQHSDREQDEIR